MAAKIKKGDKVIVIAGKDKGKQGDVLQVIVAENRVVVSGINVASVTPRHKAPMKAASSTRICRYIFPTCSCATPRRASQHALGLRRLTAAKKPALPSAVEK